MKEKLAEDLKKYEAEIAAVNKKLGESDEQRASLIAHGRRCEGIVAYLRSALADEAAAAPTGPATEAPAAEAAAA